MAVALLVGLSLGGVGAFPVAGSATDGGDACEVASWLQLSAAPHRSLDRGTPATPSPGEVDERQENVGLNRWRIIGNEQPHSFAHSSNMLEHETLEQAIRDFTGVKRVCRVELAGHGGHGAVYIIQVPKHPHGVCHTHASRNFKFAVKYTISYNHADTEVEAMKLMSGARGVVQYFGTFHGGDAQYVFMQAGNSTLDDFINRTASDKSTLQLRVSLLIQMLHALAQLEDEGIHHHDLKPVNIVLQGQYLMLADFGSACWLRQDSFSHCKNSGESRWMSPEKAAVVLRTKLEGARQTRGQWFLPKDDAWSAGVIAYQLLLGVDLQKLDELYKIAIGVDEDPSALILAFVARKPDLIDLFKLRVPEPWLPLLKGMLQPNADQRWSLKTASEAADRIAKGLGFEAPIEPEATPALKKFVAACGHPRSHDAEHMERAG